MAHLQETERKDRLVARIRRIAGQVAAIERAITGEAGLMDELVEDHLRAHVAAPGLSDAERTAGADELATVLKRHMR